MDKQNLTGQVHNAMYQHLQKKGVVSPVEVLMNLDVLPYKCEAFIGLSRCFLRSIKGLSRKDLEDWRFGRIPFLEKACRVNLKKLSTIMHEIRAYAAKSQLKPSWTLYHQYGSNRKNKLRFSKSGNGQIDDGHSYPTWNFSCRTFSFSSSGHSFRPFGRIIRLLCICWMPYFSMGPSTSCSTCSFTWIT